MALPPFATTDELATWLSLGTLSETDEARAAQLLDKVSGLIRSKSENYVDETGQLVDPLPEPLNGLTIGVAARIWENPTFKAQKTTGPFSDSFGPQVGFFLTEDELASLPGNEETGIHGIGVLSTTRGRDFLPSVLDDCEWAETWS